MIRVETNVDQVVAGLDKRAKGLQPALRAAAHEIGKLAEREMLRPTKFWHRKPKARHWTMVYVGKIEVLATVDDQVYDWVNRGTRGPYPIVPVHAKALRFYGPFKPKTTPGSLTGGRGSIGSDVVIRRRVIHPGVRPRGFDALVHAVLKVQTRPIVMKHVQKWLDKRA